MTYVPETYLMHHGVKGQKWGIRRYQNYDGTLIHPKQKKTLSSEEKEARNEKIKKAVIIGAAVVGTAALAYGGYKLGVRIKDARNAAASEAGKAFVNRLSKDSAIHATSTYRKSLMSIGFKDQDIINEIQKHKIADIKDAGKYAKDVYRATYKNTMRNKPVQKVYLSSEASKGVDHILAKYDNTDLSLVKNEYDAAIRTAKNTGKDLFDVLKDQNFGNLARALSGK